MGGETRLRCPRCGLVLYGNPAPTAGAIVTRADGGVLLVRRARDPGAGLLDVPGGFVEPGESGADTVIRELREETGYAVQVTGFVAALPDLYGDVTPTFNLYYRAIVVGGVPVAADDVAELVWTPADALPPRAAIAFASVAAALELAFGVELRQKV
jgi:ADP-ribose pyrophosphatase YjhB (NUDIX family)